MFYVKYIDYSSEIMYFNQYFSGKSHIHTEKISKNKQSFRKKSIWYVRFVGLYNLHSNKYI